MVFDFSKLGQMILSATSKMFKIKNMKESINYLFFTWILLLVTTSESKVIGTIFSISIIRVIRIKFTKTCIEVSYVYRLLNIIVLLLIIKDFHLALFFQHNITIRACVSVANIVKQELKCQSISNYRHYEFYEMFFLTLKSGFYLNKLVVSENVWSGNYWSGFYLFRKSRLLLGPVKG